MNTQNCRVGTIRPKEIRPDIVRNLEDPASKSEYRRTRYKGKLSK